MSDVSATILVVDDDGFTAEMTGMILETAGYGVSIADGAIDAMEQIANNPAISVVVSDMNMPFIDGAQLFTELRENGYLQPFVLLTGEDAIPLKSAYPEMDAVLTKDEELQEKLPETVASLLSRC